MLLLSAVMLLGLLLLCVVSVMQVRNNLIEGRKQNTKALIENAHRLAEVFHELEIAGKLSLDDKLSKWFPDLPQAERVTVRMLANCSSGYPDYIVVDSWVQDCEKNPFRVWQASELVDGMLCE